MSTIQIIIASLACAGLISMLGIIYLANDPPPRFPRQNDDGQDELEETWMEKRDE